MPQPNIVVIMTDQQRADLCAREGYPLDTTPFLDRLAREGTWFDKAYTSNPTCAPARVSLFTGRYPGATRVRCNHNLADATYSQDLIDVVKAQGYATAMCGKNHSHLKPERVDHWFALSHNAGWGQEGRTDEEQAFDQYLAELNHRVDAEPCPFPLECQGPYRAVTSAQQWVQSLDGKPFFLWLTFAEPHNPYQAPEPYYSMFPPESIPPAAAGPEALDRKGFKWRWVYDLGKYVYPNYDELVVRARSNYHGMLRLIDGQVKRFVGFLDAQGLRDDTLIVFLADHGDFVGEYGLVRKGPELPELLMRIPMLFNGPGVVADEQPHPAHVSLCDVMPTLCEAIGAPMPEGVQGRSLWPMLTGGDYPEAEFESAYGEHGFGGLHYAASDNYPFEEAYIRGPKGPTFDCLNSVSQSGQMRVIRKGGWKLVMDMQGNGQLYHLADDPAELTNLFGRPEHAAVERELLADLLAWTLRAQDPLPIPRHRYIMKTDERNYWAPYRE